MHPDYNDKTKKEGQKINKSFEIIMMLRQALNVLFNYLWMENENILSTVDFIYYAKNKNN